MEIISKSYLSVSKTLAAHVVYLIKERGAKPEEITAVTFTNQAAAEMRGRLEKALGGKRAVSRMTIGTFHAVCLNLLGSVRLAARGEALELAAKALGKPSAMQEAGRFLRAVSRVKNGTSLEEAGLEEAAYAAYCALLKERGLLDFDDLLIQALQVDTAGDRRFRHLLVDEFQDINAVQYELLCAWHEGGESLFAIGDPDQSIYGFRGAAGDCFARLKRDFADVQEVRLTENYRSTPEILLAAEPVINGNPGAPRTLSPHCPSGAAVRLMTLHAAKGMEFPAVFVSGVKAGVLPLERKGRAVDLCEERRLFYVGMTRAQEELILTFGEEPSAFLADLPDSVKRQCAPRRARPAQQLSLFS